MKRVHVKTEVRREQIAEAVLGILCTDGMSGLTAERVAAAVGIVPSALYRHYAGKAEMLEAGVELLSRRVAEEIRACSEGVTDVLEVLHCMLLTLIRQIREMQVVPRILFADETMHDGGRNRAVVFGVQQRILARVRECIAQGQAEGRVRTDIGADKLALAYMGMFVPVAVMFHSSGGALDMAEHIEANWRFFLDGITPRP